MVTDRAGSIILINYVKLGIPGAIGLDFPLQLVGTEKQLQTSGVVHRKAESYI